MPTPETEKVYTTVTPDGTINYRKESELQKAVAQGERVQTPEEQVTQAVQAGEEAAFSSPEQKVQAGVEGFLGGITLGGSDALQRAIGSETSTKEAQKRAEYNEGIRTVTGIGGQIAATALTGGAATLGESVAARTGSQLAGRLTRGAVEGEVLGLGQAVSNISLSQQPITSDVVGHELLLNSAFGVAGGAVGEGLFYGLEQGYKGVKGIRQAAKEAGKDAGKTAVAEVEKDATEHLANGFATMEEAADESLRRASNPVDAKTIVYSARRTRQMADDVLERAAIGDVDHKLIQESASKYQAANRKITKLLGESESIDRLSILDADPAMAGGKQESLNKWLDANPQSAHELNQAMVEARDAAVEMSEKSGIPTDRWAEFTSETPEQLGERAAHASGYAEDLIARMDEQPGLLNKKAAKLTEKLYQKVQDSEGEALTRAVNKLEKHLQEVAPSIGEDFAPKVSKGSMNTSFGEEISAKKFANDPHKLIEEATRNGVAKTPQELAPLIEAVNASGAKVNEAFGLKPGSKFNAQVFKKFYAMPIEEALPAAQALSGHVNSLEQFTRGLGHDAHVEKLMSGIDTLKKAFVGVSDADKSGAEMLSAMLGKDVGALDPGTDDLIKSWIANKVGGGKPPVPKAQSVRERVGQFLAEKGKKLASDKLISAGKAAITMVVPSAGPVLHMVGNSAEISKIVGATVSKLGYATEKLMQGGAYASRKGAGRLAAPSSLTLLNAYKFGEDKTEHKTLKAAAKARMQELADIAADPMGAAKKLHENLKPMWQLNPQLADAIEAQTMKVVQYLFDNMPKDDGRMMRMGKSTWEPTDQQIHEFATRLRGLDAPSVYSRLVSGRITPQEAETVRVCRPEVFAEIQKQIMNNLETIQDNCTYNQRCNLSVLWDVPVDPCMGKGVSQFFQQQFADRAAGPDQQPVKMDGSKIKSEEPTSTQKMQSR